jgi:hypothetical protein
LQFCLVNEYTNASPIPEDAPVTQTTFDVSDDMLCRFFWNTFFIFGLYPNSIDANGGADGEGEQFEAT